MQNNQEAFNMLGQIDREKYKQFAPSRLTYNPDAIKQPKNLKQLPKFFEKFGELENQEEFYKQFILSQPRARNRRDQEQEYSINDQEYQDLSDEQEEQEKIYEPDNEQDHSLIEESIKVNQKNPAKVQNSPMKIHYNFDEDYLPQVGDQVYFIPQRYQESLAANWVLIKCMQEQRETTIKMRLKEMIPKFEAFQADYGGILVSIIDIEYQHPPQNSIKMYLRNQNNKSEEKNTLSIVQIIRLKIIQQEYQQQSQIEPPQEEHQLQIYITKDNINCFVSQHVYKASKKQFDSFNIKKHEGLTIDTVKLGKVTINSVFPYETEYLPCSLYKAFEVTPNNSSSTVIVSGWDLFSDHILSNEENQKDNCDSEIHQVQAQPAKEQRISFKRRAKIIRQMYNQLKFNKKKYHWFFSEVDRNLYESYLNYVAVEFNMNLIMKRIMFDYYRSIDGLKFQIDCLVRNAGKYNSVDSDIYNFASDMRNQITIIIDNHLEQQQYSIRGQDEIQIEESDAEDHHFQQDGYNDKDAEKSKINNDNEQITMQKGKLQQKNQNLRQKQKRSTKIKINTDTLQIASHTPTPIQNENSIQESSLIEPKLLKKQVHQINNNLVSIAIPALTDDQKYLQQNTAINKRLRAREQRLKFQAIKKNSRDDSVTISILKLDGYEKINKRKLRDNHYQAKAFENQYQIPSNQNRNLRKRGGYEVGEQAKVEQGAGRAALRGYGRQTRNLRNSYHI